MSTVIIGDININYKLEGKGNTVVFINGLTMDLNGWAFQVPVFSKYFQILRYDCRGQGLSDKPVDQYTQKVHASDLKNLVDKLRLEKISIIGLSNGGMIAQHFALQYPEYLDKLILVDTCCYVDNLLSLMIDVWIKATELGGNEFRYDVTVPFVFSNDFIKNNQENILKMKQQSIIVNDPAAIVNLALSSKGHDLSESIKYINTPTLILVGEQDILIPPRHSVLLNNNIKNSRLITINDCGHIPPIEKPDVFNKEVIDFLNE